MTDFTSDMDFATHITITLKHSRPITEGEFKNLMGNLSEHINGERKDDTSVWGFKDITGTHLVGAHFDYRVSAIDPVHGPSRAAVRIMPKEVPQDGFVF